MGDPVLLYAKASSRSYAEANAVYLEIQLSQCQPTLWSLGRPGKQPARQTRRPTEGRGRRKGWDDSGSQGRHTWMERDYSRCW